MITEITRGHIRLKIDGKLLTVEGEAYLPGYGSPDFVAYLDSIEQWDAPHNAILIDDDQQTQILQILRDEMQKRNMTIEFE